MNIYERPPASQAASRNNHMMWYNFYELLGATSERLVKALGFLKRGTQKKSSSYFTDCGLVGIDTQLHVHRPWKCWKYILILRHTVFMCN